MGNVITNPDTEEECLKTFLQESKKSFEEKWEIKEKNELLVPYFIKEDYEFQKTVGTGSFGRVMVCHNRQTDSYVAVKCLSKDCIIEKEQLEHTYSEYKIMATIPPIDFLVNLMSFGQDNGYLYMVFEFVPGGELFSLLRSVGRIPEITATFYGAQVLSALHYLHNLDILYRDLKPENILFSPTGYLKLTDFGFAKRCQGRTFTLCGTPEYLAPEIILCQGYHKAVDWWAFGVLIFEMVCGHPPFYSENPMEIYKQEWLQKRHHLTMHQCRARFNRSRFEEEVCDDVMAAASENLIKAVESAAEVAEATPKTIVPTTNDPTHGPCNLTSSLSAILHMKIHDNTDYDDIIDYPEDVTPQFKDIIFSLLQVEPTNRLGNFREGVFGIKHHPFFKKVPWKALLNQKIKAPYIPKLSGEADTQNYRAFKNITFITTPQETFVKEFAIFPKSSNMSVSGSSC